MIPKLLYPLVILSIGLSASNACFTQKSPNLSTFENSTNSEDYIEPNFGACGQPNSKLSEIESKIINGNIATPNSWPWLVSIRLNGYHNCGGTLIHERYVLTAAHCIYGKTISNTQVIVGLQVVNYYSQDQVYYVEKLIYHESYDPEKYAIGYDIGLIKLKTPVKMSSKVSLICLPSRSSVGEVLGQYVNVAGWGRIDTGFTPQFAKELQETVLKVGNTDSKCNKYGYNLNNLYCLYDDTKSAGQANICSGDSGGPFMFRKNNKWYIYGLVSFALIERKDGSFKCLTTTPSFFTNVPLFNYWIINKINKN